MSNIHETAIIYEGAEIAEDVIIGPYTVIGPQVKIGKGTIVESHVVIEGETIIGEGNKIYSFASIGKDSQDLKYLGIHSLLRKTEPHASRFRGSRRCCILRLCLRCHAASLRRGHTQPGR